MRSGETVYIGDGAYIRFTGYSFELLANDHQAPTDIVSIDLAYARHLARLIEETLERLATKGGPE